MEDDKYFLLTSKIIKREKKKKSLHNKYLKRSKQNNNKAYYIFRLLLAFIFISIVILLLILYLLNLLKKKPKKNQKLDIENINNIWNYSLKYDEFDENINNNYITLQNYFCEKENNNLNQELDNETKLATVNYKENKFNMFVYKDKDTVSKRILLFQKWEANNTEKVLKALEFYSEKKKLRIKKYI